MGRYTFGDIIGISKEIQKSKEVAMRIAHNDSPALIYGETGTGKELFVSAIHNESNRKKGPFITCNCAAIPIDLAESILFGSVKGAFTDAGNQKGIFDLANKGTLYLDELNSMPIEIQGKLLRTIQEGYIYKIGECRPIKVNVRVIATVNEDFKSILKNGKLRSDLFFRLNINTLEIPALSERVEDIRVLVEAFIKTFNKKFNCNIEGITEKTLKRLIEYQWPGNIRELKNVIERAFIYKQTGFLNDKHIKLNFDLSNEEEQGLREKLFIYESKLIRQALSLNNGNISKSAKYLKIPRQTLQNKIKLLGIK